MPPIRDAESGAYGPLNGDNETNPLQPHPTRSIHALTRSEITSGLANRFVHSHAYIVLYLAMAGLSVTTVVLSLVDGCPGTAFYALEIIINSAMIAEVGVRLVAFGRQFWRSPYNLFDVVVTVFCSLTLLVLAFSGCGATSKEEEILDTLLLIARNVVQFGRLASVMRQSGHSIFARPKPIDLSAARRAGYAHDIDIMDDEYEDVGAFGRPLIAGDDEDVVFDATQSDQGRRRP